MKYTAIVIQLKTWNALAKNVSKDENKPPNWHGFKRNWQKCWNVWIIVALSLSRLFQKNNKGAIRLGRRREKAIYLRVIYITEQNVSRAESFANFIVRKTCYR